MDRGNHVERVIFRFSIVNDLETAQISMPETCSNPLCENPVVTHPKAVRPRRSCSNECKLDTWAFRRVAEMLLPLGQDTGWKVLGGLRTIEVEGQEVSPKDVRESIPLWLKNTLP